MSLVTVSVSGIPAIQKALDRLQDSLPIAVTRALNKSIESAKVAVSRPIAADLGIPSAETKSRIWVSPARPDKQQASLLASPKRIPLIEFRARGPEPSRGRGRGVSARLAGGAGRYPRAFIATMRSGHRGVYQRIGTRRLGIYELQGPSIVRVFSKYRAIGAMRGREQLMKNLQSEVRFALQQATPTAA